MHGDFNLNAQTYSEDPSINAAKVDEFFLMNGYSNIRFNKGNFTAGLRYESYLNALQDFDSRHNGNGIPYRFAQYTIDGLDVTVGNFYEQFGNGLIFRSYEEKDLGIDNAIANVFPNKASRFPSPLQKILWLRTNNLSALRDWFLTALGVLPGRS